MGHTKIQIVYYNIKARCINEKAKAYNRYGGRGITIYKSWINNSNLFYDYVSQLENYGKVGYQIDRINNDGNYEPGNLRWVNKSIQLANRNKFISNKTGYIGVYYSKRENKYRSSITVNKKRIEFGFFNSPEEANNYRNNYIIENNLMRYGFKCS